jgi:cephalosporin hydroxylase
MSVTAYLSAARRLHRRDGVGPVVRRGLEKAERNMGDAFPAVGDSICRALSTRELRARQSKENGLGDIIDTAYDYRGYGAYRSIEPMQVRWELREFAETVADIDPDTVCEIGTARGGSHYVWTRYLDATNHLSIDLPGGRFGGGHSRRRAEFLAEVCRRPGVEQAFLRGDSHSPETVRRVEDRLDGGDIDFLFIDGDHTYEGVKDDFERYSPFVSDGGLIAFHDIVDIEHDPDCEVDRFWHELEDEYETTEIIADPGQDRGGVGLVHW